MSEIILYTDKLSKSYGSNNAVIDADFTLKKGEIHAIFGANGAGKSTFVKMLYGEVLPTSGKVFLNGKEKKIISPKESLKSGISMISQDFGLVDTMTISENLSLFDGVQREKFFYSNRTCKEKAESILTDISLQIDVNRFVTDLTPSEKQLTAIAKSLSSNSDIYIFDEPTSVLDDASFQSLKQIIYKLKNNGKSIIYISHKIDEIFDLAETITVFKDSKIVLTSKINEISKEGILSHLNIGLNAIDKLGAVDLNFGLPLLTVDNISVCSIQDTSLNIANGEIVGMISSNDSLELAKSIYGLTKLKHGSIRIDGVKIEYRHNGNIEHGVAYMPGDRRTDGVFNNLNICDNIELLQFKKTSRFGVIKLDLIYKAANKKILDLRIKCNSIFQSINELSGGNQQKVLLARWMSHDFKLLILIEPSAGIDLGAKLEIYSLILNLRKKGKSFLILSSDLNEVRYLCDRTLFFNDEKVLEEIKF